MPSWSEILIELQIASKTDPACLDTVRRKYLAKLATHTGRNTIAYYSGWLRHPNQRGTEITDDDKNGFMATIHGLDRAKGLDLILHTPGGEVAATESIVAYLRKMFGTDIRVIVPQLAMSAGTMIACASKEIIMGKQSNLGPIDPQFSGIPAHGVIEEFHTALKSIKEDPASIPLWQVIISKYHPTFLGECQHAITWSKDIVTQWLETAMFQGQADGKKLAKTIVDDLSDHGRMKAHARHVSTDDCKKLGLKIRDMESDQVLQDLILTVHHCYMHTFANTVAIKIVENQAGVALVNHAMQQPPQPK